MSFMQRGPRPGTSEQGFIVLGLLITVVVVVVAGVLLGKIVHRNRFPPLEVPVRARELRRATAPLEVTYGAVVTRRVDPGEPLWVRPAGPGEVVVFYAEESPRIVGYAPDSLLIGPEGDAAGRHGW